MLLDMLGVAVGFMAVMLVLSLLVTAITQFIQAFARMRPRNFEFGLAALLEDVLQAGRETRDARTTPPVPEPSQEVVEEARRLARGVIQTARYQPEPVTKGMVGTLLTSLAPAPHLASLDLRIVLDGVRHVGSKLSRAQEQRLKDYFGEALASMRARFERNVKAVAFGVSSLVAVVMQVDAPALVTRLSVDANLRAAAVALGERLAEVGADRHTALVPYSEHADSALRQLQQKWPEEAGLIEQAIGLDSPHQSAWQSFQYIVEELNLILREANHPESERIVADYASLLDGEYRAAVQHAGRLARQHPEDLAALDIRPWREGWSFYTDWRNWLGMAITAILISLGAPFWHDAMRKTFQVLRDVREEARPSAAFGEHQVHTKAGENGRAAKQTPEP
jgi:hypothetical protein